MNKRILFSGMAAALCSVPSYADHFLYKNDSGYNVAVGGEMYVEGGSGVQKALYPVTANNGNVGFDSATSVHLTVENKSIQDLTVGVQVGVATHVRSTSQAGSDYWDRTYLYIENPHYGYIEFGTNEGAALTMETNGTTIAVATGGADGAWSKYFNTTTSAVNGDNFMTSPGLLFPDDNFERIGTNERSRKATYYTPKYQGFQFGVSYIPDVTNYGSVVNMPNISSTADRNPGNGVTGGLTWEKEIDSKQDVNIALIGEYGRLERSADDKAEGRVFHNVRAFEIGGTYRYDKITIGASYGNQWDSNAQKIAASIPNAYFYTVGAKYDYTESTRTSISYFHSEKFRNSMNVIGVGIEHDLAPGLLPYMDVMYINMKQKYNYADTKYNDTTPKSAILSRSDGSNDGVAIILGTKISF